MKRNLKIGLLCILLLAGSVKAQNFSTMGTDFWVTFLASNYPIQPKLYLAGNPCTVTIENPYTGWSNTTQVYSNTVAVVSIPMNQCYSEYYNLVEHKGIHITATDSISLFAGMEGTNTYEASNIYPTQHLRSSYLIQTYGSNQYGAEFAVVGTVDSTVVDIVLTDVTTTGQMAGDTVTVTLNIGECYRLHGSPSTLSDFSGTRIKARDCKPIAVMEGNQCAYIPSTSCDMIFEQSIPTDYWGTDFIVMHTENNFSDYVQILSRDDQCTITVDGQNIGTRNAGGSIQIPLATGKRYIHTSKPVSVALYMGSGGSGGQTDPSMVHIHPLNQMITKSVFTSVPYGALNRHYITIVSQTSDIMNLRLDNTAITPNFQTVLSAPGYSCANISLSSGSHKLEGLNGAQFTAYVYGGGNLIGYAYSLGASCKSIYDNHIASEQMGGVLGRWTDACIALNPELYLLNSGGVINYEWVINGGVPITDSTIPLAPLGVGTHHIECHLTLEEMECYNLHDTLLLDILLYDQITVHDADTINPDQLPWTYRGNIYTSGIVGDSILLTGTGGDCDTALIYTLVVRRPTSFTADTTICPEDFPITWHGHTFQQADTQQYTLTNQYGYDSIITLTVHAFPPSESHITGAACDGAPFLYEGQTYTDTGDYDIMFQSVNGCDSIVHLHIRPAQSPEACIDASPSVVDANNMQIQLGDCSTHSAAREWYIDGQMLSTEAHWRYTIPTGQDSAEVILIPRSSTGCTDTAATTIHVDRSALWVPNTFTPDLETNNHFAIVGNQLTFAEVSIFSRKGLHIITFDGLKESWDGTFHGIPCPEEAYVYVIKYSHTKTPRYIQTKIGTVTLLR